MVASVFLGVVQAVAVEIVEQFFKEGAQEMLYEVVLYLVPYAVP